MPAAPTVRKENSAAESAFTTLFTELAECDGVNSIGRSAAASYEDANAEARINGEQREDHLLGHAIEDVHLWARTRPRTGNDVRHVVLVHIRQYATGMAELLTRWNVEEWQVRSVARVR